MTHWRAPDGRSHRYVVNPWPLAIAASLLLWGLIWAAGYTITVFAH